MRDAIKQHVYMYVFLAHMTEMQFSIEMKIESKMISDHFMKWKRNSSIIIIIIICGF